MLIGNFVCFLSIYAKYHLERVEVQLSEDALSGMKSVFETRIYDLLEKHCWAMFTVYVMQQLRRKLSLKMIEYKSHKSLGLNSFSSIFCQMPQN